MSEARKIELDEEDLQEVAIFDDDSAEYMLRRIREATEQYERMEAWYTHQLEKCREVRDRTVAWAENNLRGYLDMVPAKATKTQRSYELPGGKLVLKHQAPKFETKDEELVPWLKANRPELVKIKESSDWENLKKELKISPEGTSMVTEDGEIVPGITVTPREDKFTVTIK